jgi:nicotinate phosphoribosyltransferase
VAKRSPGKATRGGPKAAFRRYAETGCADAEVIVVTDGAVGDDVRRPEVDGLRPLQTCFVRAGRSEDSAAKGAHGGVGAPVDGLAAARAHHARCRAELPAEALGLGDGEPALRLVELD